MNGPIDPRVGIGHVHLKVADLDRALGFYSSGVFGWICMLELTQRYGQGAAFCGGDRPEATITISG